MVERFTRLADGTLNYEFTVDHPEIYSRPWTAAIPMRESEGSVYEYACHEGNYRQVENALAGSRVKEKTEKPIPPGQVRQGGRPEGE